MKRSLGYRALFADQDKRYSPILAHDLEEMLAVHPAPEAYRAALRAKLLAAASDETFYRRGMTRQIVVSMIVVIALGLSVAGLIAWRNGVMPFRRAVAQ